MIIISGYCCNNNKVLPIHSATYGLSRPTVTLLSKYTKDILTDRRKHREKERKIGIISFCLQCGKKTRSTFRWKSTRSYNIVLMLSARRYRYIYHFFPFFAVISVVLAVMDGCNPLVCRLSRSNLQQM